METDKQKMSDSLRDYLNRPVETRFIDSNEALPDELPPLRYADDDAADWIKLEDSFSFLYGGKCAYVSQYVRTCIFGITGSVVLIVPLRDLMQFAAGMPNDGAVDLTVQCAVPRMEMLSAFDGAEHGALFWRKSVCLCDDSSIHVCR